MVNVKMRHGRDTRAVTVPRTTDERGLQQNLVSGSVRTRGKARE
jgi:hypothetical protein